MVAIFVSTADELIAAIGYTVAYDLSSVGRRLHGNGTNVDAQTTEEMLRLGRRAMFITSIVVAVAYIGIDLSLKQGATLIGAFLACYAPLVALAPSLIIPVFIVRKVGRGAVYLSLVGGAALGIASGILPLLWPNLWGFGELWTYLPPIVSFGWSWVIYAIGLLVGDNQPADGQG